MSPHLVRRPPHDTSHTSSPPISLQNELFREALRLIPSCAFLYLCCQLLMGSPGAELFFTIGVGIGCFIIYLVHQRWGAQVAHLAFIIVILGLFIPSWLQGGGAVRPTRFFSVIFFSMHVVLFQSVPLSHLISLWMAFTLTSVSLEYLYPDLVGERLINASPSLALLIEQGVVHLIVFLTCGLLLRHTVDAFKRAESRLQEANRAQRDLLRITSHDLRGPVNNLQLGLEALASLNAQHLQSSPELNDSPTTLLIERLTPTLKLQVQHMDFLMRNLSYFRLDHHERLSPHFETIAGGDLITQVSEGWRLLATRGEITLLVTLPDEPLTLISDRMFCKQILDNLISNALKFSPSRSTVEVSVSRGKGTHDTDLIIEVTDQGPGVPLEDQARIFRLFERAGDPSRPREHSIGLGLWIVSLLAPLIHAEVTVCDSPYGEGATFRCTLKEALIDR